MRDLYRAVARSSLHALASLTALVAGCTLTTSLDGLSDHRARSDGPRDAGATALPRIEMESGLVLPDVETPNAETTQLDGEPAVAIDSAVEDPCPDGACRNPLCSNGALDGDETAVDCGGSCAACPTGQSCLRSSDCVSKVCSVLATSHADADVLEGGASDSGGAIEDEATDALEEKVCLGPECSDRVMNGSESDVDCGGSCPRCLPGARCGSWIDCSSSVCTNGRCAVPSCTDGVKNGDEPGVDCGGGCPKCLAGQGCLSSADCVTLVCEDNVCKSPSCTDHVKNGVETDIDCGGGACPKCPNGDRCVAKSDCQSGQCAGGICRNF